MWGKENFQKAEPGYKLEEIEKEKARRWQLSTLKQNQPLASIEANRQKSKTSEFVTKYVYLEPLTKWQRR